MTSQAEWIGATFTDQLLGNVEAKGRDADLGAEVQNHTVVAFVGMDFEAKIAAGPGVLVVDRSRRRELAAVARTAARQGCRGFISFGVAGGLAPHLRAGDLVVASAVIEQQTITPTDSGWSSRLIDTLGAASYAPIAGVENPLSEPAVKRDLHRATGAAAVDMESHTVARLAAAHGLPFAAVRVVIDPAERTVPPAALAGMNPDGRTNTAAVLREIVARPAQLLPLMRVALDAFAARAELVRVRRVLGSHFALSKPAEIETASRQEAASLSLQGLQQIELAPQH